MGIVFGKDESADTVKGFIVGPAIDCFYETELYNNQDSIMEALGADLLAWSPVTIEGKGDFIFYHTDACETKMDYAINEWMNVPYFRGSVFVTRSDGQPVKQEEVWHVLANRRKVFSKELKQPSFRLFTLNGLVLGLPYKEKVEEAYEVAIDDVPDHLCPPRPFITNKIKDKKE